MTGMRVGPGGGAPALWMFLRRALNNVIVARRRRCNTDRPRSSSGSFPFIGWWCEVSGWRVAGARGRAARCSPPRAPQPRARRRCIVRPCTTAACGKRARTTPPFRFRFLPCAPSPDRAPLSPARKVHRTGGGARPLPAPPFNLRIDRWTVTALFTCCHPRIST